MALILQPMLRDRQNGPPLLDELKTLSGNGRSWLAAETALAKATIASDGRRLLIIAGLAIFAAVSGGATALLAAFGMVVFLAPFVGGLAQASLVVTVLFLIVVIITCWILVRMLRTQLDTIALFERWGRLLADKSRRKK